MSYSPLSLKVWEQKGEAVIRLFGAWAISPRMSMFLRLQVCSKSLTHDPAAGERP